METLKSLNDLPPNPYPDIKCERCDNMISAFFWCTWYNKPEWRRPQTTLCNDCISKDREEQKRKEKIEWENKRFISYGLNPINKKMTFDSFKVNENNKKIYDFILKYSETLEGNIFLTGKCGNGKTHLASALAMKLFINGLPKTIKGDARGHKDFRFIVIPQLLLEIRDTFKKDSQASELDIIEKYVNSDYLILDDFGAEKISEWTLETIFLLIDTRIRNMKPFFITSNLSISEIGQKFNDRIASRIAGECSILELNDTDHRLENK